MTRSLSHQVFNGTSSLFFALVDWAKVPALLALGQFTWANMQLTLIFLPVAILSTFLGVVLVKRISPERFYFIINILMIAIGLRLLQVSLS